MTERQAHRILDMVFYLAVAACLLVDMWLISDLRERVHELERQAAVGNYTVPGR